MYIINIFNLKFGIMGSGGGLNRHVENAVESALDNQNVDVVNFCNNLMGGIIIPDTINHSDINLQLLAQVVENAAKHAANSRVGSNPLIIQVQKALIGKDSQIQVRSESIVGFIYSDGNYSTNRHEAVQNAQYHSNRMANRLVLEIDFGNINAPQVPIFEAFRLFETDQLGRIVGIETPAGMANLLKRSMDEYGNIIPGVICLLAAGKTVDTNLSEVSQYLKKSVETVKRKDKKGQHTDPDKLHDLFGLYQAFPKPSTFKSSLDKTKISRDELVGAFIHLEMAFGGMLSMRGNPRLGMVNGSKVIELINCLKNLRLPFADSVKAQLLTTHQGPDGKNEFRLRLDQGTTSAGKVRIVLENKTVYMVRALKEKLEDIQDDEEHFVVISGIKYSVGYILHQYATSLTSDATWSAEEVNAIIAHAVTIMPLMVVNVRGSEA